MKQSLQEFIFNMNIPTRVGFQTPFTNVTMDLNVPSNIAGESVIIGGEVKNETYGEFQNEMDIFNSAFAEVFIEGDARNRIFTFPIPTYNITKDFDWSNRNLDRMWEMTARYGIPYFANYVNSDMDPEDARSMCCRLRLDNRELRKRGGGLFGANPLTGSIGVVTINMPQLAYLSRSEDEFYSRLEDLMIRAKDSLEIKRKVLEGFTENNLYPYTKHYLSDVYMRNGRYWGNHFSTIGIVGMNEACLNMLNTDIASIEGKEFFETGAELHAGRHHEVPGGDRQISTTSRPRRLKVSVTALPERTGHVLRISGHPEPTSPTIPTRCICPCLTRMISLRCWTTRMTFRHSLPEGLLSIFSLERKSMI